MLQNSSRCHNNQKDPVPSEKEVEDFGGIQLPCVTQYRMDWQAFSAKGQIINILGFVDHAVVVTNTQLCFYKRKAAINNKQTN
jgi:hypothetical protein